MKINVYFKEIKLGELSQVNNNFVYKANEENIALAHKMGYSTFLYDCDESFISEELPYSLQSFIPNEKQFELANFAGITKDDSSFEKLYKIAKLDVEKPDFHVEV